MTHFHRLLSDLGCKHLRHRTPRQCVFCFHHFFFFLGEIIIELFCFFLIRERREFSVYLGTSDASTTNRKNKQNEKIIRNETRTGRRNEIV